MNPGATCLLLFASIGFAAAVAQAQDESEALCAAPKQWPLPDSGRPDAAARARLQGCESQALYDAGDDVDARLCAWIERERGDELVFGGSSILMMIHANGRGVARDFALARRFACEAGGAPAEVEARLQHLAAMEQAGDRAEPIDLCDDITSGYMMGFCADRDARVRAGEREWMYQQLLDGWSDADQEAWGELRGTATAFFDARVENEVDVSGTARGAMIAGERDALEAQLFDSLLAFERGEFPQGDAQALSAIDAKLNASYAAARKAAAVEDADAMFGPLGTIRPEGIRDTERVWIRYRDAWVAFGAKRYPSVSADAWRTWATTQRERQLRELYEGM